MKTVDELLTRWTPFQEQLHAWEGRTWCDAAQTGHDVVAGSRSRESAPTPYAVQVLWSAERGIEARAIRWNRAERRWEDVTDERLLKALARETVEEDAYRGLQSEEIAQNVVLLDVNERLRDELIDAAYEQVDQYGMDAYKAGRFVLRELFKDDPELRWRHHRAYRADDYETA